MCMDNVESIQTFRIGSKCMWKNKKEWTPEVCASIDGYGRGLSEGIDKNILHICTKRRSDGNNFCELVLRKR
ncbi:MAG: hypothetical protein WA130_01100 [Candidatus Methanoperedens sp.]